MPAADGTLGRARSFSTLREGSLHAALKAAYAGDDGRCEVVVDGFVVDVERDGEIVEIQTASVASIRRKLERLVERHPVLLVHPVALERWLVRVDADGAILHRRRSPKRGLGLDAFDELMAVRGLFGHPNFRVEIAFIREEEVRGPVPPGARFRYPREWWRLDRRLLEIVDVRRLATAADLLCLLPDGLPAPFTSADIVSATRRSRRLAMRAAYCLEQAGATSRAGRKGRLVTYDVVRRPEPPRDVSSAGHLTPPIAAEEPPWKSTAGARPASPVRRRSSREPSGSTASPPGRRRIRSAS